MSFWTSELGEITGNAKDAFANTFKRIPDNTTALALIESFVNVEHNGYKYLQVNWKLTSGDFKGQKVGQKFKVFDQDAKVRHRGLNMLKLLYNLCGISPQSMNPPTDGDLLIFVNKQAGIRIQETEPNAEGKQYNWVSEIHPATGFVSQTGISKEVVHSRDLSSAFSRNTKVEELDEDLPF